MVDPQENLLDDLRQATLGEFEIMAVLGRGETGTVYIAHEIALERTVAIKLMSPAMINQDMADRFEREARTAAALSHPHIIPLYGVRQSGRLLFLVMKFVQGRSLNAIIKEQGALPIKMVQTIIAEAGSALDYAHRHGIVHRDIKPAHIMIDTDGWTILTGFARVREPQGLTMTGAAVGSPTYMSPEQCSAKEITSAADQYSLGIAAYEMLTGKVPFDSDSVMSLVWQHLQEAPAPVTERRPDSPPELARAIEKMLAKAPADRWRTLEEAIEAMGTPTHNDPIRQQMRALVRESDLKISMARAVPSPIPRIAAPTKPKEPVTQIPPPPHVMPSVRIPPISSEPTAAQPAPARPVGPAEPITPAVLWNATNRLVRVFYITDRRQNPSAGPNARFGGRRGTVSYGFCEISVPPSHEIGVLERPSVFKLQIGENPAKHIAIACVTPASWSDLVANLDKELSHTEKKQCLLFVHGYNVSFEDAARRTGQLKCDLGFAGPTGFFSWPSLGCRFGYPVDENNVEWATPHLRQALLDLATQLDVTGFNIIAHSMGNRAVTQALIDLKKASGQVPVLL